MATKAIVGTKIGMTQVWDEENRLIPVTALAVKPCRVVQVKSPETDGYAAVQVTWGDQKPQRLSGGEAGHFDKAGISPGVKLVELRLDDVSRWSVGDELTAGVMVEGELVDVTAVSKGKGFAGAMKRHNFAGQRASHGAHRVHRKPGSVGQCATPSRVFKGKKLPGRMGAERVTTQNLQVVSSDPSRELLLVKGSVPGPRGATVVIRNAVKSTPEPIPEPVVEEEPVEEEVVDQVEEAAAEAAVDEAASADDSAEQPEEQSDEAASADDSDTEESGDDA